MAGSSNKKVKLDFDDSSRENLDYGLMETDDEMVSPIRLEDEIISTEGVNATISNIVHLSGPPVKDVETIYNKFWELTARKRKTKAEEELGPFQFHKWSTMNFTTEGSPTLKKVVEMGGCGIGRSCKEEVGDILEDLLLDYSIVKAKTFNKKSAAIFYDIKSVPKLSFCGIGATEEVAVEEAAKKALNFFIKLSQ